MGMTVAENIFLGKISNERQIYRLEENLPDDRGFAQRGMGIEIDRKK